MFLLLTYSFSRFLWLLKTSCGRFSNLLLDRSLKGSRGNALELSENTFDYFSKFIIIFQLVLRWIYRVALEIVREKVYISQLLGLQYKK